MTLDALLVRQLGVTWLASVSTSRSFGGGASCDPVHSGVVWLEMRNTEKFSLPLSLLLVLEL